MTQNDLAMVGKLIGIVYSTSKAKIMKKPLMSHIYYDLARREMLINWVLLLSFSNLNNSKHYGTNTASHGASLLALYVCIKRENASQECIPTIFAGGADTY